ncbi:DUF4153 domain-containing protein [Clostridium thermarum]|uniref:DUF4153 domain-containing protein n=1 Tax=Clostridium thermarum TaxID=1716543 RepID=UPI0013D759B8|nr:DUF4173 domain-containing protein [Clostridium thermarum]
MSNREKLTSLLGAVLIGILWDRVLYNGFGGLGFSIVMIALVLFYYVMLADKLELKGNKGLLFLAPLFIIMIRSTIYDNKPIQLLNALILPVLMTGTAIILWFKDIDYSRLSFIGEILGHMIMYPLIHLGKPFLVLKNRLFSSNSLKAKKVNPYVVTGIVISVPLLLIVLVFLSSADMMFSYYVNKFFNTLNFLDNWGISDALSHIILVFIFAIYFFSFVWGFSERKEPTSSSASEFAADSVTISIPLAMLNVIYFLFAIVQFSYLYGNGQLPEGYTYAEYARRGFFELVAVTIINFSIILFGLTKTKSTRAKVSRFCSVLYTLLALFTLNMLYSAHYKMRLYETTYGYTYLRVYVHLFMALLLILNLTALVAIWYKKIKLPKVFVLGSLIFYTLLNVINVDSFIAKQNIEIYRQNGKIDFHYLTSLSDDAVPYLIELTEDSEQEIPPVLVEDLNNRRERLMEPQSYSIFRFNVSKNRARKLLK